MNYRWCHVRHLGNTTYSRMFENLVPANSHLIKPWSFPTRGVGIGFGEYGLKTKFDYLIWIDTAVIFVHPVYSWLSESRGRFRLQSARGGDTLCSRDCPGTFRTKGLPGRLGGWNTSCLVVFFFLFRSNWRQLELQVFTSYKLFTIGRKLRNWEITTGMNINWELLKGMGLWWFGISWFKLDFLLGILHIIHISK